MPSYNGTESPQGAGGTAFHVVTAHSHTDRVTRRNRRAQLQPPVSPADPIHAAVQLLQLSHTAVSLPRSVLCWTRGIHSGSCRALPSSDGSSIWQPQQAWQQDGRGEFDACGSYGTPAATVASACLHSHTASAARVPYTPASIEPRQRFPLLSGLQRLGRALEAAQEEMDAARARQAGVCWCRG